MRTFERAHKHAATFVVVKQHKSQDFGRLNECERRLYTRKCQLNADIYGDANHLATANPPIVQKRGIRRSICAAECKKAPLS